MIRRLPVRFPGRVCVCGPVPLVLVYPRELLTSYWAGATRGISRMLDTRPRLSSDARLLCSSGPPAERPGDEAPPPPPPPVASAELQLFLPLVSLSRPALGDESVTQSEPRHV